ncbi:MAG: hypothetical protein P2A85_29405 (plasmid) [Microcoleus anatoxicus]|uniref:hypothetical protein n=1 Tax=Microcoleus anatoxicus TaxID=2705319 RepID=UPI00366F25C4
MSFINKSQLGIYAPKASEKVVIGAQAQTIIKDALSTYKKLYYGLRQVAWQNRDKGAAFSDAKSKGELQQFIIAPGCRQEDGSYSKDEWDYQPLNKHLWERFCTHFEDTFGLERIQELTKLKDLLAVTEELLSVALDEWGHRILERIEDESLESLDSIPRYTTDLKSGIRIEADFRNPNKRAIVISATQFSNIPDVLIEQMRGDTCWQGRIYFDTTGVTALTSKSAKLLSEMLELAAKVNTGIKEFIAAPDFFLDLESAQARKRNLQRVKERLVEINENNLTKKQVEAPQQQATRRINEAIDAAENAEPEEFEEARNQANRIKAQNPQKQQPQPGKLKRRAATLDEVSEWMERNAELIGVDMDTELGIKSVKQPAKHRVTEADRE